MRRTIVISLLTALALALSPALAAGHEAKTEQTAGDKKKDKDKDKKIVRKFTTSESYVMLDPIYTSILDGSRPLGLLMVGIGLDIPNAELRDRADRDMPQLRDGYVRALMIFSASSVRPWAQPDVAAMADRLQAVTDRVLGRKGARVLLAQVAIRLNK